MSYPGASPSAEGARRDAAPLSSLDLAAELERWRDRFERGIPNATAGEMPWGSPMAVDLAIAEAVWHRLGNRFLEERDPCNTDTPWALQRFGQPRGK